MRTAAAALVLSALAPHSCYGAPLKDGRQPLMPNAVPVRLTQTQTCNQSVPSFVPSASFLDGKAPRAGASVAVALGGAGGARDVANFPLDE